MQIPAKGISEHDVMAQLKAFGAEDLDTRGGGTWAYAYDSGRGDVDRAAKAAYSMFLDANGLDPTVFPSLLELENRLTAMAATHLGGGPEVVGNFTSGGTESILLAVKTARDYYRDRHPAGGRPRMILPATAHAAFHKAAHYLDVDKVLVPVDPVSFTVDPDAVKAAITPDTMLLVGSAVSYAHGVTDPIAALGELALAHDTLLHVDGCIGAFLLPYFHRLGAAVTPFDFSVPGVTSISMDWHKYAYCPKGASVVLYRDKSIRKHQIFACADWPGYTIVNTALQSSKSGGPLAAAWAVLNLIGEDGFLKIARRTLEATRRIVSAVDGMAALRVLGRPEASLVACASDSVDVFEVVDEMKTRGWYVQPQLSYPGSPANIHLSIDGASLNRVDDMLADLSQAADAAKRVLPEGRDELADFAAALRPDELSSESVAEMMAAVGIRNGRLPVRMAPINRLLDAMSIPVRERLLTEFFNDIFIYR